MASRVGDELSTRRKGTLRFWLYIRNAWAPGLDKRLTRAQEQRTEAQIPKGQHHVEVSAHVAMV